MDPQLEAFRRAGHALANKVVGRTVVIDGRSYTGPRSELEVDPGDQQQVAMRKKRAFSITITLDQFAKDSSRRPRIPRDGMELVDDQGYTFKIDRRLFTALTVQFFCVSKNS